MKKFSLLTMVVVGSLMVFGCSKKEENKSETATVPTPGPVASPINIPQLPGAPIPTTAGTATALPFTPVSKEMMEYYVASHPLNNPSNYNVQIQLKNAGEFRYAGEVRISYTDSGRTYTGIFTAPEGVNSAYPSMGEARDSGLYKSHYNYWFVNNGKTVFTGFFQDPYGAIVLVIDSAINLGDGQGNSTVSGSIWFKNFAYSFAPQSTERNCWFIYMGPYDCRSSTVINKSAIEPSDGYRKLGTFSGLVTTQAFQ
jgi:hypothetical protein